MNLQPRCSAWPEIALLRGSGVRRSFDQSFRNLNGVQGGALEELIPGNPKTDSVVEGAVLAKTAHSAVVLPRDIQRKWVDVV